VWNVDTFRSGLAAGSHTLTGHWFTPCRYTLGPCVDPNETIETFNLSVVITFS